MAGDDVAIDALGLLAEPFDEGGAVENLAFRLGERLAHLQRQDHGEVVGVLDDEVVPAPEDRGALLAGPRRPVLLRGMGGVDGGAQILDVEVRHLRQGLGSRRISDREGPVAAQPPAADEGAGFE